MVVGSSSARRLAAAPGDLVVHGAATFEGNTVFNGKVSALAQLLLTGKDLAIGTASASKVTINGILQGSEPLTFEGATEDDIRTVFAIADPTASASKVTINGILQ